MELSKDLGYINYWKSVFDKCILKLNKVHAKYEDIDNTNPIIIYRTQRPVDNWKYIYRRIDIDRKTNIGKQKIEHKYHFSKERQLWLLKKPFYNKWSRKENKPTSDIHKEYN